MEKLSELPNFHWESLEPPTPSERLLPELEMVSSLKMFPMSEEWSDPPRPPMPLVFDWRGPGGMLPVNPCWGMFWDFK